MSREPDWSEEIARFDAVWRGGYMEAKSPVTERIREYLLSLVHGQGLGHSLEIGCGGGFWSPHLAAVSTTLICVDIKSAEENRFWQRVKHNNVVYFQVTDPHLNMVQNSGLDFVFSYGVFCHLSPEMQEGYLRSSFLKCKDGAKFIVMYADANKYRTTGLEVKEGPRWHWVGVDWFSRTAEEAGWSVTTLDLHLDPRHPISVLSKG